MRTRVSKIAIPKLSEIYEDYDTRAIGNSQSAAQSIAPSSALHKSVSRLCGAREKRTTARTGRAALNSADPRCVRSSIAQISSI